MRRGWKVWVLAIVTTFAFAPAVAAQAPSPSKRTVYYRQVSGRLHHNYIRSLGRRGGRVGYARNLVGNPDSGLGFDPLPIKYRIGAWRYRLTHRRPYWQNPVLFAIAADAARTTTGFRGIGTMFMASSTRTMVLERRFLAAITGPAGDDRNGTSGRIGHRSYSFGHREAERQRRSLISGHFSARTGIEVRGRDR